MKITTTFKQLHDAGACKVAYRKYAKHVGGVTKYGRTTPINLLDILDHNGLADFWWIIKNAINNNEVFRLIACDIAESVLPIFEKQYPDDKRPREVIEIARKFAKGKATREELATGAAEATAAGAWVIERVKGAARAAVGAAARDARDAAWDASWAAVRATGATVRDVRDTGAAQLDMQIEIIKTYLSY